MTLPLSAPTHADAIADSLDARWPEETRRNNKTFLDHRCRLKAFEKFLDGASLDGLTFEEARAMIQRYLDSRRLQQHSPTSVDNDRRVLSALFSWLIAHNRAAFAANPAAKNLLHTARPSVRCRAPLSDEDVRRLLDATRDTALYPHVLLCLAVGLRPIGASRVRAEHFDPHGRTLRILEKGRERVVPVSAWFVSEMTAWLATHRWQMLHGDTATHYLARLRVEHDLPPHVTFQALRRTFLNKLYKAGVPPQLAARLAGNSVAVIEKHYVDLQTLNAHGVVDALAF